MADKMTCPGCGSHTSTILSRFNEGQGCDVCGLSSAAMAEIITVQERRADAELKAKLEDALKRADKAEDQARRLRNHLDSLISMAKSVAEQMDDPRPWLKDW